ncbi:MAG: NosD domain-containing protein, partial [Methanomicrobiales archaeon]
NILIANNASGNDREGFGLWDSYSNTLTANNAGGNYADGFYLSNSNSNTLTGNTITGNIGNGLTLSGSTDNVIYNNYFNNSVNVNLDSASTGTTWNTTLSPALDGGNVVGGPWYGGNYWGYPNGTGPSDTRTYSNNDGINETAVDLGEGNYDYLPLVRYIAPAVLPYWLPLNTSAENQFYNDDTPGSGYWVANLSGHGWYLDFTGTSFSTTNGFALLINQSQTIFNGMGKTLSGGSTAGFGILVKNQTADNYALTSLGELTGVSVSNVTVTGFTQGGILFNNVNGTITGPGEVHSNITDVNANYNTASGIVLQNSHDLILTGNNITYNPIGLSLSDSENNVIYNNYFNNSANLDFQGTNTGNVWNTTFSHAPDGNAIGGPSFGGNYWGYPNGTGPSDIGIDSDNDGINDTAFDLGDGNHDYLPLVRYTGHSGNPYWIPLNTSAGNPYYYNSGPGGYWVANISGHGWYLDFFGPSFSTTNSFALLINQSQTIFDGMGKTLSGGMSGNYGIVVKNQTAANYDQTSLSPLHDISIANVVVTQFRTTGLLMDHVVNTGSVDGDYTMTESNITNVIAFGNGDGSNPADGIRVSGSRFVEVSHNIASGNTGSGINVTLGEQNVIHGNTVADNSRGIYLRDSALNYLTGNYVSGSFDDFGIWLFASPWTTLRNNNMSGNRWNFDEYAYWTSQDIDTSNTVDGRPIMHLLDPKDITIDNSSNAGTIYILNGQNISIRDLQLSNNGAGVFFLNTSGSTIENVSVANSNYGIMLRDSDGNNLTRNNAIGNQNGIELESSDSNNLTNNNASGIDWGFSIYRSSLNTLSGNIATGNSQHGFILYDNSNSNNLTDNTANGNTLGGFRLYNSDSNNLTGNYATNNDGSGFWLTTNSNSNNLTGNTATGNKGDAGFRVTSSNYNILSNNTATG